MLLPNLVMFAVGGTSEIPSVSTAILLIVWLLIDRIKILEIRAVKLKTRRFFSSTSVCFFLGLLCLAVTILVAVKYQNKINLKNLRFQEIYETRELYNSIYQTKIEYLKIAVARIFAPIFIVYMLHKKRFFWVILGICIVIYLYLFGAVKSIFLGVFAAVLFYPFENYHKLFRYLLIGMLGCLFISFFLYCFMDINIGVDLFFRRLFFSEAMLSEVYAEYFTKNYTYWMHTKIGWLAGHIYYDMYSPVPLFMGKLHGGLWGISENVGIITEGYLSLGYAGVFIHSLIIAIIFRFFSRLKLSSRYFGLFFMYIYYMNTSFLFTLFLSHGLFALVIASGIFLKNSEQLMEGRYNYVWNMRIFKFRTSRRLQYIRKNE